MRSKVFKSQCTMIEVLICFTLNGINHDANRVHLVLKKLTNILKQQTQPYLLLSIFLQDKTRVTQSYKNQFNLKNFIEHRNGLFWPLVNFDLAISY